jgi:uncharacterized protein (DUF983 family)
MPKRASIDQPVRSPAVAVLKGLCPRCRRGRIFRGTMVMRATCPVCDLKFAREPGYFLAAMYFSYAIGIVVLSLITLILWLLLPEWQLQWLVLLGLLPALLFVPWVFRFSRVLWIHFDRHFDPD